MARRPKGTHRCRGRDPRTGRILPGWALDRRNGKLYRTTPKSAPRARRAAGTAPRPAPVARKVAAKRNGNGVRKSASKSWAWNTWRGRSAGRLQRQAELDLTGGLAQLSLF